MVLSNFLALNMFLLGVTNAGTASSAFHLMKVEGSAIHSVSPLLPITTSISNINLGITSDNHVNSLSGSGDSPLLSSTSRIAGIKKFVTIHIPPIHFDEPQQPKVIRVGGEPNKHVNIIFVKLQASTSSKKTEVILPQPPQHKSIVYVLLKKQDPLDNVRIVRPPVKPVKPEVFFIRYKSPNSNELRESNLIENSSQPASIGGTFVEAPIFTSFSAAYGPLEKNFRNYNL